MNPLPKDLLPIDLLLYWGRILLFVQLFSAVGTGIVAKWKGRSFAGWFFLGLFLGPFAFLLILCLPRSGSELGRWNKIGVAIVMSAFAMLTYAGVSTFPGFIRTRVMKMMAPKLVMMAEGRMRWLGFLLEAYHADHQSYPPAESFPRRILSSLNLPPEEDSELRDPFAVFREDFRKDYGYRPQLVNGRPGWVVWSIGPDLVDDGGAIEYDATNGLLSRGDIVLDSAELLREETLGRNR